MNLTVLDTDLSGVKETLTDRFSDLRGEYGGVYDEALYSSSGLTAKLVADQVSRSRRNVLRGIHGDGRTTKLVQCLFGEVVAVVVDLRRESPDFGKWRSFSLSDRNHRQLWVPPMYGLSYYTISDEIIFTYKLSHAFSDRQFTVRWNDPALGIDWGDIDPILSERDRNAPLLAEIGGFPC